jgi:hypothetical protein
LIHSLIIIIINLFISTSKEGMLKVWGKMSTAHIIKKADSIPTTTTTTTNKQQSHVLDASQKNGNHPDDGYSAGCASSTIAVVAPAMGQPRCRNHGRRSLSPDIQCSTFFGFSSFNIESSRTIPNNNNNNHDADADTDEALLHLRRLQVGDLLQGLSLCGKETRATPHVGGTDLSAPGGFPDDQRQHPNRAPKAKGGRR